MSMKTSSNAVNGGQVAQVIGSLALTGESDSESLKGNLVRGGTHGNS